MSRIGKKAITVPSGVTVSIDPASRTVSIEGSKGKLSVVHRPEVTVEWLADEKSIVCRPTEAALEAGNCKAYWGLTRALINNMVEGVCKGYTKKLQIVGVGYSAKVIGPKISLKLGFANEIILQIPQGVECLVDRDVVTITGPDKQKVGEMAAKIRNSRKPEPYNGKGVRYLGEVIRRKQGKAFGA
jgi:large subunit ribosomal protein L6